MESLSALTLTLALVGKSFIAGGWAAVQVFSAETFPTVIRNIGIAICSISARVGGIVAPQFVYLGNFSKAVPFTIFGSVALACSLLLLLLRETRGQPLPDALHGEQRSSPDSLEIPGQCEDLMDKQQCVTNGHCLHKHDHGQGDGQL
ncbi:solute carrier family 22 member 15-like [Plakobranchus ocellatus]|uniref:Solute carrier family 22 member 15-like n=1 Tax=Plakobranchus ocellatus TaxID=259542 RepID=A0AAV4DDA8_9GAST|nr:solute carrier family 22 member 15-like [Plakobranchus ocellatus]